MYYFPGRKIEYPEDGDEREEYEIQLAAELEFVREIEINLMVKAIVKAFSGD
ncbi:hypothetical protein LEP1GSC034_1001 [Leptospira interrogans str. 2003000735]|uniref:Uncharacterized protein n=2 Tax=Leptospira interrogans TaxID=173 RepID=A0A829DCC5_LEPIR|nr:hypothetical protein [Leptospira interrogans]EMY06271.1 hypothetical protein LEP1GSC029_3138 [Leptospira interrogans str. 2002000626]EMY25657.1 hypothetical protein LEP1GSC115_1493 [Leptospira interrogans serovar Australis str. 200703203]EKN89808.1 hypothetical protein LEP1GSC027_3952 [Leptospira interrogans str. 2002000624]EKQ40212.1 hypothetical protein LEP1GSC025_2147 [Leptospira interrogans str. 2002000621]EKQ46048.1 hypothetical protein LEP1GSC026_3146 [Leptospira interrogans str. 2002